MATTNKEYLTMSLAQLNVSDTDIDVIILKAGIDGEAPVDVAGCDLAVYNRFSVVIAGMTQNVSEGGYSLSWDIEAVKLYYNTLCRELGKENVLEAKPKIRNRSNFW
jgi:hypothetical protein